MATKHIGKTIPRKPARHFAEGGEINPGLQDIGKMSQLEAAQFTNDPAVLNAALTRDNLAASQATTGMRGPATGYQSYSGAAKPEIDPIQGIVNGVTKGIASQFQPKAAPAPTQPVTDFEQDSKARQSRINSLNTDLRGIQTRQAASATTGDNQIGLLPGVKPLNNGFTTPGFADGGKPETADELMARMAAKYGAPSAGPTPVQNPLTAPPIQQPQPKPQQGPGSGILGIFKGRQQQIDKASGYANGKSPENRQPIAMASTGIAAGFGGKIKGPGTPTSDSIPANVRETGEPIKVSTEERIVSAEQEKSLARIAEMLGFKTVDAMFESMTGKPVGPTINGGIAAAANGMGPEDEARPLQGIGAGIAQLGANQPIRTTDVAPGGYMDQGAGILASRNKSGQLNVTNVGTQGIADMSKRIVDGSESALIDQKNSTYNPSRQLANMQRLRLESDANDPSITDPTVRENARQQLNDSAARAAKQGEAYTRSLTNQLTQAKIVGESQVAGLQTQYLSERDPTRRNEIAQQIRAIGGKGEGGPSLGQQSDNIEIDAARRAIEGMPQEEIKRRTANYTATGRENPEYDESVSRAVRLASRRKVGADDHFDQRMQAQPAHGTDGDTVTRFRSDQSMKGHALGKQTPNGVEVMDASGKVIGHYR